MDLTLKLTIGTEPDKHLLDLAVEGKPVTLSLQVSDGSKVSGVFQTECVVMEASTEWLSHGLGERTYRLRALRRA